MKVQVCYRDHCGETVALWPEIVADMSGGCQSYQHVGQHGAADFDYVMQNSKPAASEDKAVLRAELLKIGYNNNEC